MPISAADIVVKYRSEGVQQVSRDMDSLGKKTNAFGQTLSNAGRSLTTFVSLPIAGFFTAAFMGASSLEQAMGKVDTVFGDSATEVLSWATTTADAFGVSETQALAAAGGFGMLFDSIGLGQPQMASMSTQLVQLSADMGAFNDVSAARATDAIFSALVGEYDALQRLGINITAARVEQEAMNIATAAGRTEITEADRTLARYNIIMAESALQQGQFAKESEGAAGSMAILKANLSEAAASLGMVLLPAVTSIIQKLTDLVRGFQELPQPVQKFIVVAGLTVAALGPFLMVIGSIATGLTALSPLIAAVGTAFTALGAVMLANPIIAILTGIVVAIGALYVAYETNFLGFRDGVNAAIIAIKGWVDSLKQAFIDMVDWAVSSLNSLIDSLNMIPGIDIPKIGGLDDIATDASNAQQEVVNLQNALTSMATQGIFGMDDRSRAAAGVGYTPYANPYNPTEGGGGSMGGIEYTPLTQFSAAFDGVAKAATSAATSIEPVNTQLAAFTGYSTDVSTFGNVATVSFQSTGDSAKTNMQPIGPMVQSMAASLTASAIPAFTQVQSAAQSRFTAMAAVITASTSQAASVARAQFSGMAASVVAQVNSMAGQVQGRFNALQGSVSASLNAMVGAARSAGSQLAAALASGANTAVGAVSGALSRIPGIIAGIGGAAASTAYSVGANISNSFASGMLSALGTIQAAAAQMVSAADQAIRAKARIASPSKVFAQLGGYIGEGFEEGIKASYRDVARASSGLVSIPAGRTPGYATAYAGRGGSIHIGQINITQQPGQDGRALYREFVSAMEADYDRVGGIR